MWRQWQILRKGLRSWRWGRFLGSGGRSDAGDAAEGGADTAEGIHLREWVVRARCVAAVWGWRRPPEQEAPATQLELPHNVLRRGVEDSFVWDFASWSVSAEGGPAPRHHVPVCGVTREALIARHNELIIYEDHVESPDSGAPSGRAVGLRDVSLGNGSRLCNACA